MKLNFSVLMLLSSISFMAQKSRITNQEFSLSFGLVEIDFEKLAPNQNLDFLNYAHRDFVLEDGTKESYVDSFLKYTYKADLFSKISVDLRLIMFGDFVMDTYDISARYNLKSWFGIGGGSVLNKIHIEGFEEFHTALLPDYFPDSNSRYFETYELGFFVSPTFKPLDGDIFKIQIRTDIGMSKFTSESDSFSHKKQFSNERIYYSYQTISKYQAYFWPKLNIQIRAFKIKNKSFGFNINTNYYYSSKSMDYQRTIQEWTVNNQTTEQINTPKHKYTRFEINTGLFVRW